MFPARFALVSVVLLGSLGIGASCNRNNTAGGGGTSVEVRPDPNNAGGGAQAASPNAAPQVTQVPGVNVSTLSAQEREQFWAVANDELSPCGDPHSLAVCGRDRTCPQCVPALNFLARRVQDGFPREQIGDIVRARYARNAVVTIRTEGAPVRGPAVAPVTLVEFSDYECPHCAHAAPVLRDVEREFGDRLRVIHMHFPLSGHIHAMAASRAAVAAQRQNKFWEFHDLLFANQNALDQPALERYATQIGLDMNRFRADQQSQETEAKVAADRREGERLQIDGTPAIFINGRRYALPLERGPLREWIQEEIDTPRQ